MYLLTPTLQALTLLAWYLDSPPTAHHGLHLANCSSLSLTCLAESRKALHDFQQQRADEYFAKSEEARGREGETEKEKVKQDVLVMAKRDEVVRVKIGGEGNVSIWVEPEEWEGLGVWFESGGWRKRVVRGVFGRGEDGNKMEADLGVDALGVEEKAAPALPDGLGRKAENGTEWVYAYVRVQGVGWVVVVVGLMCVYSMHYLLYLVGKSVWRCCGGGGNVGGQAGAHRGASCNTVNDAGATVDLEEDDDEEKVGWPGRGCDEDAEEQAVGAYQKTSFGVVQEAGSTVVLEEDKEDVEVERESAD